jgi:hypothetical protein
MISISHNITTMLLKQAEAKREASKEKSLHDWFSRKGEKGSRGGWVDCNAPDGSGGYKACGRSSGEERGEYPACRPTPGACKEKGRGDSWGKKSEEEKKKDDACTRKVKARYDVWPSAYASGAVTKCREVGADNWGNKTKEANTFASDTILDVPIKCTPGFGCKRYFTPEEQLEVDRAKAQMFPMLFPTEADPISSQLSSPTWAGLGTGLMGALLGAGAGAGTGALLEKSAPLGALIGGTAGGLGGLLYGYGSRTRKNKEIEDLMEDLPVGADLGDVELFSDPRLKAQMARDFQRQLVRKGLMG